MVYGLYGLCVALMLVMRFAPDSWVGSVLNKHLVNKPLEHLADFERHKLFYLVIMSALMIGGGEVIILLGPEVVAAYAMQLAIYYDAVLVAYALAAAAVARNVVRYVRLRLGNGKAARRLVAARRRRSRPVKRMLPSANDDDGPAVFALAA
ncbi:hypothetical protein [Altererythrobacter sp. Root672]|uniref:hypothetical protein n=1 Tax=Altererythrobacter sp. Root672 TaxID=1736584 RepID=UPI0006FD1CF5|nr:hypothetical protein [Altererythrobacter sp. Root672]KRA82738.1 hypothetical protein ASD76_01190 [Altererythrobacter sp. Root672]